MNEQGYLDLLHKILHYGNEKSDRTGTGTISLFGEKLEFDLLDAVPILTTKKVLWKKVIIELLWFLKGDTNVKNLQDQGVNFWNDNTTREFLDSRGLYHLNEWDMGKGYGFQWRHWGTTYKGCEEKHEGFDQIKNVIHGLKTDPFGRRHIVTAWNPADLKETALPPCHVMFQFNVVDIDGIKYLDCMLTQRSCDIFLGSPFNIASYSILTYMVAHVCGFMPRKFVYMLGDVHIYKNHVEAVKKQLEREPRNFPQMKFARHVEDIDDFCLEDFILESYDPHPYIYAKMAV